MGGASRCEKWSWWWSVFTLYSFWWPAGGDSTGLKKNNVSLWENDPTSHFMFDLSKKFPDEFLISVSGFRSTQHDVHSVNYVPSFPSFWRMHRWYPLWPHVSQERKNKKENGDIMWCRIVTFADLGGRNRGKKVKHLVMQPENGWRVLWRTQKPLNCDFCCPGPRKSRSTPHDVAIFCLSSLLGVKRILGHVSQCGHLFCCSLTTESHNKFAVIPPNYWFVIFSL